MVAVSGTCRGARAETRRSRSLCACARFLAEYCDSLSVLVLLDGVRRFCLAGCAALRVLTSGAFGWGCLLTGSVALRERVRLFGDIPRLFLWSEDLGAAAAGPSRHSVDLFACARRVTACVGSLFEIVD